MRYTTPFPEFSEKDKKWYVIDAENVVLGRLAAKVATILQGKNKPSFNPSTDCGDYIIIINAEKVKLTGRKLDDKKYYHHSGYPGGIKEITAKDLLKKHPERLIKKAVKGMIPKGPRGYKLIKNLKVYAGSEHPHKAQKPVELKLEDIL